MVFAAAAVERAMKIQEAIMRALSGAITWLQAADILGLDPRSVRRWRARYDAGGLALAGPMEPGLPGGAGTSLEGDRNGLVIQHNQSPSVTIRPCRPLTCRGPNVRGMCA